jgi:hypothetical protein
MPTTTVYTCSLFSIDLDDNKLTCTFKSGALTNLFMQTELSSKLLSSFVPDSEGVWRPGNRSNFEIVGWPRHLVWTRLSETTVASNTVDTEVVDSYQYGEILEKSLGALNVRADESDGGAYYHFSIGDDENVHEYSFNDRARVIAALCVLYDLEGHDRNHLEINIPVKYVAGLKWPIRDIPGDTLVRHYGDPSKTADVLRNEGWTREGDDPHMFVANEYVNGQRRQTYKITTREQSRGQQVKRTAIKPIWRTRLFEEQGYTCRICLNNYTDDPIQLSPDHRVPVIFQADNLTDDNFMEKLMTLCRFCNQQKREFCKRIGADYDWDSSPWSYPEKYRMESAKKNLLEFAKFNNISPAKAAEQLAQDL